MINIKDYYLFEKKKKNCFNIAVVGPPNVGKTSIITFLKYGEIGKVHPTFGINYETLKFKNFTINFYDLSGKEEYRPYWKSIIKKCDLVIYVVDALDLTKIKESRKALKDCIQVISNSIPIAIFLNKTEQTRALTKKEIIELYELQDLTKKNITWNIFEVSALTGLGIPQAFKWIFKNLTNNELKIGISLSEIIVFDKTGKIIFSKNNLFPESSDINLTAGFVFAVHNFAKQTINEKVTRIIIGPYKLIVDYVDDLIGVMIVHKEDSDNKTVDVLSQILTKIKLEKKPISESSINKFIAGNMLSYIFL
ncbi:MAG: ADP-ribosylation factor-like protein [Candidatus Odinarchaeia archaeon]